MDIIDEMHGPGDQTTVSLEGQSPPAQGFYFPLHTSPFASTYCRNALCLNGVDCVCKKKGNTKCNPERLLLLKETHQ